MISSPKAPCNESKVKMKVTKTGLQIFKPTCNMGYPENNSEESSVPRNPRWAGLLVSARADLVVAVALWAWGAEKGAPPLERAS